jgi:hypothetical protein
MVAFIVCMGIVTMTLGQGQSRKEASEPAAATLTARAKLLAQVAELRAELEVLQVEHEVDRELLRATLKDQRNMEILEANQGNMDEMVVRAKKKFAGEADSSFIPLSGTQRKELEKVRAEDDKKELAVQKAMAEFVRPIAARMKKEFQDKTTELNRKSLELAELERRLKEAR